MKLKRVTISTALIVPEEEAEDPRERIQLGPLCIAASLRLHGCEVDFVNLNEFSPKFQSNSILLDQEAFIQYAAQQIVGKGNRVIGLGSICSSYRITLRLIQQLKKLAPEAFVFMGGPQATATAKQTLEIVPQLDAILKGEADFSILELVNEVFGSRNFERVRGLVWRRGTQEIVTNESSPVIEDLDKLPMPAYDLYPRSSYAGGIAIDAGRGCPFGCTFCSTNEFFSRRFRMKSGLRLVEEIDFLHQEYGTTQFSLTHDLFTTNPKLVRQICTTFQEEIKFESFEWTASARIDSMKDDLTEIMAKSGCTNLFFGVESGSASIQKTIKKKLSVHKVLPVLEECAAHSIESTASIIIGYPEETYEDIRDSIELAINAIRIPNVKSQIHLLVPLPGTPLSILNADALVYSDLCSNIATTGGSEMTDQERTFISGNKELFTQHFYVPNDLFARETLYHVAQLTFFGTSYHKYTCLAIQKIAGEFTAFAFRWADWACEHIDTPNYLLEEFYRGDVFCVQFEQFTKAYFSREFPDSLYIIECAINFDQEVLTLLREDYQRTEREYSPVFDLESKMRLNPLLKINYFPIDLDELLPGLQKDQALPDRLPLPIPYLFSRIGRGRIVYTPLERYMAVVLEQCTGNISLRRILDHTELSTDERRTMITRLALMISQKMLIPTVPHGSTYDKVELESLL
ncbi:MAG: radical SAM protein [Saprospiraceae bacterium]|nr:radical SAM protein [Lewinella sp.]